MMRFLGMPSINKLAIATEVMSYANCVPLRLKINLNIWDAPALSVTTSALLAATSAFAFACFAQPVATSAFT